MATIIFCLIVLLAAWVLYLVFVPANEDGEFDSLDREIEESLAEAKKAAEAPVAPKKKSTKKTKKA